jgi:UDP-N-acetyl-D-mannosaminuronic acid transferase (WecB/TagA/CpsF family)
MNAHFRLALLLLAASVGTVRAAEWQVVLLKPRDCATCSYVEEMLKRSAQLQQVVLDDGAGGQVTARIQRRASSELSAQEWIELRALPWFNATAWKRQAAARSAQVLLKRDGTIVSAGDIAESADLRSAQFPPQITTPDVGRDVTAVRNARSDYYQELYLRSWNLDWFYRLALDPTILASRSRAPWLAANAATLAPPLAGANVFLMSTATGAADNEIFNALRIEEIRDALTQSAQVDADRVRIFYGGDNPHAANALEVRNGRYELIRRNVAGSVPFTPVAVTRIFQSIRARPASRNLLVLVGHGSPEGAGMWGSPAALPPAAMRTLHEQGGGDDVLVSGNCFGGVMARATSCGFFGARPDIVATGCQADAAEVAQSRDYLHTFFSALAPGVRRVVDVDGDNRVTFAEAHWYASLEGDTRNVTYTSVDALADAWFESAHDAPRSIKVRDVLALAAAAPPAEARALRTLLNGYDAELVISLEDLAEQAGRWDAVAPRPLVGQLARRLLFVRSQGSTSTDLARVQACENRAVTEFLAP